MVVLGLSAWRQDVEVAAPLNAMFFAPQPSPYRTLTWWLFGAAVSCTLTLLTFFFLSSRRRLSSVFIRAVSDVCMLLAYLFSGPLIGRFVHSTLSRTGFECILPGFTLLWAPALLAIAAATLYHASSMLRHPTPGADPGVA
jgi:hypothetical protein